MPRHFLVKRQKSASSIFPQHEPQVGDCRDVSFPKAGFDKVISVIKENDNGDYGSYGSPDSGYADSPKSLHAGSSRDKEHFFPDREQIYRNRIALDKSETTSSTDYVETMNTCHVMQGYYVPNIDFSNSMGMDAADEGPIDLSVTGSKNLTNSSKADRFQKYHSYFHPNSYNDPKRMQSSRLPFQQQQIEQEPRIQIPPFQADAMTGALYLNPLSPYGIQAMPLSLQHHLLSTLSPSFAGSANASSIDLSQDVREKNLSKNRPPSKTEVLLLHSQDSHLRKESTMGGLPSLTIPVLPSMVSSISPGEMKPLNLHKLLSPPSSSPPPVKSPRRKRCNSDHSASNDETNNVAQDLTKPSGDSIIASKDSSATPLSKLSQTATTVSSSKSKSAIAPAVKKTSGSTPTSNKKLKAVRKLNFDIDTTSPVSGTIIKDASEFHPEARLVYGDIEPSFNFVEATPEARAELDRIENRIGDYICQLCKELFEDAFQLAQHRCSRIVHVEYRCPECDKVFNCPANLASHRRWHKPKANSKGAGVVTSKTSTGNPIAPKPDCNGNDVKHTLSVPSKWKSCMKEGFETHVMPVQDEISQSLTKEAHSIDPTEIENKCDINNPFPKLEPSDADSEDRDCGSSNLGENTSTLLTTRRDVNSCSFDTSSSLTPEERSLVLQVLNNNSHGYTSASAPPSLSPISVSHLEMEIAPSERIPTQEAQSEDNVENITTRIGTAHGNVSDSSCRSRASFKDNFSPFHRQTEYASCRTPPPYLYNSKNNFQCSSCGKSFQRHAYLRKHIVSQHKTFNDDSSIKMTINDIVTEALNMSDNERDKTQQSGEQLLNSCAICSKTFVSESARLKHETLAHGMKIQVSCSRCQQTFASKLALDKHTRIAHSSESFACKYCSSTFHSSPGLTRHINKCHPTENRQVILLQIPATCT